MSWEYPHKLRICRYSSKKHPHPCVLQCQSTSWKTIRAGRKPGSRRSSVCMRLSLDTGRGKVLSKGGRTHQHGRPQTGGVSVRNRNGWNVSTHTSIHKSSNTQNGGPGRKELPTRPLAGSRAWIPYWENISDKSQALTVFEDHQSADMGTFFCLENHERIRAGKMTGNAHPSELPSGPTFRAAAAAPGAT